MAAIITGLAVVAVTAVLLATLQVLPQSQRYVSTRVVLLRNGAHASARAENFLWKLPHLGCNIETLGLCNGRAEFCQVGSLNGKVISDLTVTSHCNWTYWLPIRGKLVSTKKPLNT